MIKVDLQALHVRLNAFRREWLEAAGNLSNGDAGVFCTTRDDVEAAHENG